MIKTARTIYRTAGKGGGLKLHWLLSAAVHAGLLGGLALLPPGGAPEPGYPVRLVRLAPEEKAPAPEAAPIREPKPRTPPSPLPPPGQTSSPGQAAPQGTAAPRAPERAVPPPGARAEKKKVIPPREAASAGRAPRQVPPAPPQEAKPFARPGQAPASPPKEESPPPPAATKPASPAPAPRAEGSRTASLPPLPGEETLSPRLLRERLAQIVARIERAKRYPEAARLMGVEGTAVVAFRIRPDGRVEGLAIRETSGHPALDEATLEAVRRAQPLPHVRHALVLPVRYTLREAER